MTIPHITTIGMISGAMLLAFAATPATAGDNAAAYSAISVAQAIIGKTKESGYSHSLIAKARMADQRRSGDEEWEACKASHPSDDIVTVLGDCFCLTTPEAPCGGTAPEPAD